MNYYALFFAILAAFYGLFVGSFLNVCIYRIPLNQTIVTIPSHCTTCNHKLAWYDLFPLFSYLFLGGKCRYCKAHISAQYPIVEALNSVVWGFTAYLSLHICGLTLTGVVTAVCYCLFFSALIVLSGIDIFHQIVPDKVNIFIMIVALPLIAVNYTNWLSHVVGFFVVSVPLLILMMFGGMGGGDVKLYAAAGFLMGWRATLVSLILACFVGTVMGLPVYIPQKRKGVKHPRIPFVPAISIAMFISLFWGNDLINWYISTFFATA
jgi:leader peptidase (prepilin peptidase)/N-methyltransferase